LTALFLFTTLLFSRRAFAWLALVRCWNLHRSVARLLSRTTGLAAVILNANSDVIRVTSGDGESHFDSTHGKLRKLVEISRAHIEDLNSTSCAPTFHGHEQDIVLETLAAVLLDPALLHLGDVAQDLFPVIGHDLLRSRVVVTALVDEPARAASYPQGHL